MADNIINYGTVTSYQWKKGKDFIIQWNVEVAYKNSNTTWMVGRGNSSSGVKYKIYQDSNNNNKYDGQKGDTYVGYGGVSAANYAQFSSLFKGAQGEVNGYSNYTADILVGGLIVGSLRWI